MADDNRDDKTGAALAVDEALIRRLAELMEETGLSEIEVVDGERGLRVARGGGTHLADAAPAAEASAPASEGPEDLTGHPGAVTSPMVGTVYLQPEPGAPPFVQIGDTVAQGETLLIVEAMKTMNPIPAPRVGTVSRILVQDATPVEFGEVLLILD